MTDYTEFDAALIERIKDGAKWFHTVHVGKVQRMAMALAGMGEPFRLTDRRLQALRKAGRLAYDRSNGWRVL